MVFTTRSHLFHTPFTPHLLYFPRSRLPSMPTTLAAAFHRVTSPVNRPDPSRVLACDIMCVMLRVLARSRRHVCWFASSRMLAHGVTCAGSRRHACWLAASRMLACGRYVCWLLGPGSGCSHHARGRLQRSRSAASRRGLVILGRRTALSKWGGMYK